jgi:Zn finger protein HypA/HybF involved in hydrogenase expression
MPRRITTEDFIERAKMVHGCRYDYSRVEYLGARTKVTIICPDHGLFKQRADHHLRKVGCPDCGGNKRLTKGSFIQKAKVVHGDRYHYSQVEYKNNSTKIMITCPDHGPFQQTPATHLRGRGCPVCGNLAIGKALRLTAEEFIKKAKSVHGDFYSYSQIEYVDAKTKAKIICPDHGLFRQTPSDHLYQKSGCPRCAGKNVTTELFVENARAIHGDRYDYSQVRYVNPTTKVAIICPDHGPFQQTPNGHLNGSGCLDCGFVASATANRLTKEEFVEKARGIHGDRYDYSEVEYVNAWTNTTIICPEHGPFQQPPTNHLYQRSGCPDCAETGFNPNDRGTLYYIAITTDDGDTRYKIGVTNHSVNERFRIPADRDRIRIVKTWHFAVGRAAAEREATILRQYAGDRYSGADILVGAGNTEIFTHDILGLDK